MSKFVVHIVSERVLFRKTFNKLISLLDNDVSCQEQPSPYAALTDVPAPDAGAVLVDCGAMDADAVIACMLHWLSIQPEAIIILVIDEQVDAVVDAGMDLGAMGVIVKAAPPQHIIDSLHRILAGERCRPAPAVDVPRDEIPEHMRRRLSARQQKMLRATMGGQSISSTASELGMTPAKVVSEMQRVIATIRGQMV